MNVFPLYCLNYLFWKVFVSKLTLGPLPRSQDDHVPEAVQCLLAIIATVGGML